MASKLIMTIDISDVVAKKKLMVGKVFDVVRDEVNVAALNIQKEASRLCPVDTGRLRASIRPRFFDNGIAADVFTDVAYAPFVEFGTVRMRARPYMTPAYEHEKDKVAARLRAKLGAL